MPFPSLLEQLYSTGYTGPLILDFYSGIPQFASGPRILKTKLTRGLTEGS